MNRKALRREGMTAAAELRDAVGYDQFGPADPYLAAERLGVKVVFLEASMEGFYLKQKPARILLSCKRPVARRAFTCAHELGHHVFGHGSTIDQLQQDDREEYNKPEEIMANAFGSAFLMPSAGVRGAFARRGWNSSRPEPLHCFTVACEFGVGYETLANHLYHAMDDISEEAHVKLKRSSPQKIRKAIVGEAFASLTIVDAYNTAPSFDVEKGSAVVVLAGGDAEGDALRRVKALEEGVFYEAVRRGRSKVVTETGSYEIRVMPKEYKGAAAHRFLEDPDEQE